MDQRLLNPGVEVVVPARHYTNVCSTATNGVNGVRTEENSNSATVSYYCNGEMDGGGWTLYMVDGKGTASKDVLQFVDNNQDASVGTVSSSLGDLNTASNYKMAQSKVNAFGFTEVMAMYVDDAGVQTWVKIKQENGNPFTAEMVFSASSLPPGALVGKKCPTTTLSNPRLFGDECWCFRCL